MNREDLRLVEFTVVEKTKAKKGKKTQKKAVKKVGYFHLWGTNVNGKGNEKFFGLVEEATTGNLLEVTYKDIRFLSEDEVEEYFDAAEETTEIVIVEEVTEEAAPVAETPAEEAAPAAAPKAPAKPRPSRAKKA